MSWSRRQSPPEGRSEGARAHLERYVLQDELGQGGMSVVFRAHDKQLSRQVAVKLLHDFLARQADARKRFHREAVAVARLRHPGIVEIYDYSGPDAEDAYIVCELIDGLTLRAFIEQQGPPAHPEVGALVILELVRALRHAHEQGVVHRDVKPENVMITRRGQLKLMDFGIAQIMESATRLTATGTLLGSPAHMAPEVIDGQPSDHRSDIFSVGTLLYWLCTGQLPFSAPNPSALFRQILEGAHEPPQMLQPRLGNGLARVIDRALAREPEDRYQDVSDLQADLQRELDEVGLEPADSLVKQYFLDPGGFCEEWRPKLVEALATSGRDALANGQTARAMDRFNRVLSIDPEHPEVRGEVSKIGRRAALNRGARRAGLVAAAVALLFALGWGGVALYGRRPAPEVSVAAGVDAANAAPSPEPEAPAVATARPDPRIEAPEPAPAALTATRAPIPTPARVARAPEPRRPERAPPATRAESPAIVRARRDVRPASGTTARGSRAAPGRDAPEVASEPASPATRGEAAPAAEPGGTLVVKIGRGWANVRIDGQKRPSTGYGGSFRLPVGRHQVSVYRPDGRYRPRTVEVAEDGALFEVQGGQRRRLAGGEILFRMPGPDETDEGWVPNEAKEARIAPPAPRDG